MIESTTTTPLIFTAVRILLEGIIDEFLLHRHDPALSEVADRLGSDLLLYLASKKPESMREKLIRDGLEPTLQNALAHEHDAAGVRLICPMVDDVYRTAELIRAIPT